MFKLAAVFAVLAVASAAPGFVGTGSFSHGPALFPGTVGYGAAAPALLKEATFGAIPVASVAYSSPAIVKSAVVAPIAVPASTVIKAPIVGSYGFGGNLGGIGGHLGGYGGHLGGHYGGFGGHFVH